MKAIANSMEPKGLEPGVFPRAVRPVLGFDFEQLFAVIDLAVSDVAIGGDAELTDVLPVDEPVPPLAGPSAIDAGPSPLWSVINVPQAAQGVMAELALDQTPPDALKPVPLDAEAFGAAVTPLWPSDGEAVAVPGVPDAGLMPPFAPGLEPMTPHAALQAKDAAGEAPRGVDQLGPDTAPAVALKMPAVPAQAEAEFPVALDGTDAAPIPLSAPKPLAIKGHLAMAAPAMDAPAMDAPASDAMPNIAAAADPGTVEAAARTLAATGADAVAPVAKPLVTRPPLELSDLGDAAPSAKGGELPESAGKAAAAAIDPAKIASKGDAADSEPEPTPKPAPTVLPMPSKDAEKILHPTPAATAVPAGMPLNATAPVISRQQGKAFDRAAETAAQPGVGSAREIAALALSDSFRPEAMQPLADRAEPAPITTAQGRAFGSALSSAPAPAPVVSAALPAAFVLNMRHSDWGRQLSGQIERMVATGSHRIELSLRPKNLGQIQLSLEMRGDQTRVHIVTETAAAARLLIGAEERLAQALDQSGYRLSGFSAQEQGTGAQGGQTGQQGQQGQPSPRRSRAAPETTRREDASDATAPGPYSADRGRMSGINMLA